MSRLISIELTNFSAEDVRVFVDTLAESNAVPSDVKISIEASRFLDVQVSAETDEFYTECAKRMKIPVGELVRAVLIHGAFEGVAKNVAAEKLGSQTGKGAP